MAIDSDENNNNNDDNPSMISQGLLWQELDEIIEA